MNQSSLKKVIFSCLLVSSLSSTLYLNSQAKELQAQGYSTTPELFEEDFEKLLPDVKIVTNILSHLRELNNI